MIHQLTEKNYGKNLNEQLIAYQYSNNMNTNKLGNPSEKTPHLLFQFPLPPQTQHQSPRLAPPVSPKPRTRSETSVESTGRKSALMLPPASPSRKYFNVTTSPVVSAGKRRVSEPALDGVSKAGSHCVQLSVTDRKWEKLRSFLVAMRNEPCDTENILCSSSSEMLDSIQEMNTQKDQFTLHRELSYLHSALKEKEVELRQAEAERDSALLYIRHLKVNLTDAGDKTLKLYERGIDSLKSSNLSKENVVDMLTPLVKELHEQKSYLDCLMTVVLMRAPWMLDEVDKMELPNDKNVLSCSDDLERGDFQNEGSDNEVWC